MSRFPVNVKAVHHHTNYAGNDGIWYLPSCYSSERREKEKFGHGSRKGFLNFIAIFGHTRQHTKRLHSAVSDAVMMREAAIMRRRNSCMQKVLDVPPLFRRFGCPYLASSMIITG